MSYAKMLNIGMLTISSDNNAARQQGVLKINTNLLWFFLLFGRLV